MKNQLKKTINFLFLVLTIFTSQSFSQEIELNDFKGTWIGITENGDSLIVKLELFTEYSEITNSDIQFLEGTIIDTRNTSVSVEGDEMSLVKGFIEKDEFGNNYIAFVYRDFDKLKNGLIAFSIDSNNLDKLVWNLSNIEPYNYKINGENQIDKEFSIPTKLILNRMN